jgi:hypothetical protein
VFDACYRAIAPNRSPRFSATIGGSIPVHNVAHNIAHYSVIR